MDSAINWEYFGLEEPEPNPELNSSNELMSGVPSAAAPAPQPVPFPVSFSEINHQSMIGNAISEIPSDRVNEFGALVEDVPEPFHDYDTTAAAARTTNTIAIGSHYSQPIGNGIPQGFITHAHQYGDVGQATQALSDRDGAFGADKGVLNTDTTFPRPQHLRYDTSAVLTNSTNLDGEFGEAFRGLSHNNITFGPTVGIANTATTTPYQHEIRFNSPQVLTSSTYQYGHLGGTAQAASHNNGTLDAATGTPNTTITTYPPESTWLASNPILTPSEALNALASPATQLSQTSHAPTIPTNRDTNLEAAAPRLSDDDNRSGAFKRLPRNTATPPPSEPATPEKIRRSTPSELHIYAEDISTKPNPKNRRLNACQSCREAGRICQIVDNEVNCKACIEAGGFKYNCTLYKTLKTRKRSNDVRSLDAVLDCGEDLSPQDLVVRKINMKPPRATRKCKRCKEKDFPCETDEERHNACDRCIADWVGHKCSLGPRLKEKKRMRKNLEERDADLARAAQPSQHLNPALAVHSEPENAHKSA